MRLAALGDGIHDLLASHEANQAFVQDLVGRI